MTSIPNIEFYAPWFREPITRSISYADYRRLSDHGRDLARFHVLDSSETLESAIHLNQTPQRLKTESD